LTGKTSLTAELAGLGLVLGLWLWGCLPEALVADDGLSPIQPATELRLTAYLPTDSPAVAKRVYRLRFSPSGNHLAIRDGANQVWQYQRDTGTMLLAQRFAETGKRIEDLAYSADGQWLYAIADSGRDSFQCWSSENLELVLRDDSVRGQQLAVTLAGEMLVNGRDALEMEQPGQVPKIRKRAGLLRSLEGSVSMLMYNLAGVAGESGLEWRERLNDSVPKVVAAPALPPLWQPLLQRTVGRAVGRQAAVGQAMQLSPDGNRVALQDKRAILLWDVAADQAWRELSATLPPPQRLPLQADIYSLRFSPNGQWLAISTIGESGPEPVRGEVHLVDVIAGRWLGLVTTTTQTASAVDFSADQRWLAVGSTSLVDDRIQIIDLDQWLASALPGPVPRIADPDPVWRELAGEDPRSAVAAVLRLRHNASAWQPSLTKTLTYDPEEIVQNLSLIRQRLSSPKFQERELAEQELRVIAEHFPLLLQELQSDAALSSECHFRLQRIQAQASAVVRLNHSDWRLYCRLLQALETIPHEWADTLLDQATHHPVRSLARQARVSQQVRRARGHSPGE
jgi:hypothetical protein